MTYSNTVTSKGQVTIPADFRRRLGIKSGETVNFKLADNNQLVIEKNNWEQQLTKLHSKVAAHLKKHHINPLSDEELDDAINAAAEQATLERYQRNLG